MKAFLDRLRAPVAALPLDIFRVLTGLYVFAYFVRLIGEIPDTMGARGFIDHALMVRLDPHTRLSLFQPGTPDAVFYLAFAVGLCCAVGIVIGWRPRGCAFFAWIIAVSAVRWFFLVIDIDDTMPELFLFWLVVMPVGETLVWSQFRQSPDRAALWRTWSEREVGGTALRCFLGNLMVLYLVAGLTKSTSPMWRQGFGLYASLKLQLTRFSGVWNSHHLWFLRIFNYLTLLFEPTMVPLMIALPKHSRLKYVGLVMQIGFHLGIVVLVGIPYANVGLVLALVLVFHAEIADAARRRCGGETPATPRLRPPMAWSDRIAIIFVCLLALCQSKEVPLVGAGYEAGYGLLYLMGTQQDYHVFNWIELFNWSVRNQVMVAEAGQTREVEVPATELMPAGPRYDLMQTYLHSMHWTAVPWGADGELRRSLLQRLAARFARRHANESGLCTVSCWEQRITPDNPDLTKGVRRVMVVFRFGQGEAACLEPY